MIYFSAKEFQRLVNSDTKSNKLKINNFDLIFNFLPNVRVAFVLVERSIGLSPW